MYGKMQEFLREKIAGIKSAGLYKQERVIAGPQQARVSVAGGAPVLTVLWIAKQSRSGESFFLNPLSGLGIAWSRGSRFSCYRERGTSPPRSLP